MPTDTPGTIPRMSRDGKLALGLLAIALLGPYLPRFGDLPLRMRLDHVLIPVAAAYFLLRAIFGGKVILPRGVYRYLVFLLWFGAASAYAFLNPISWYPSSGVVRTLAGAEAYIRPMLVLFIAVNIRVGRTDLVRMIRFLALAGVPLYILAFLQLMPATQQAANEFVFTFYTSGSIPTVTALINSLSYRAMSIFGQFPTFGMYALLMAGLLASQLFGARIFARPVVAWALFALTVMGGFLSGSKLFLGGIILLVLCYFFLARGYRLLFKPKILASIIVLVAVIIVALPRLYPVKENENTRKYRFWVMAQRFEPSRLYNLWLESRLGSLENPAEGKLFRTGAVDIFTTRPVAGLGVQSVIYTTDSFIFGLLVMCGTVGLILYLLFLSGVVHDLREVRREIPDATVRALSTSMLFLTAIFLLATYGFHTFIQDRAGDAYWLILGILTSPWLRRSLREELAERERAAGREPEKLTRIALQQRVLAAYRLPFFKALADKFAGELHLLAGEALPEENIQTASAPEGMHYAPLKNIHLANSGWYTCWQHGVFAALRRIDPDLLVVEANFRILSNHLAISWMRSRKRAVVGWGLGTLDWNAPGWLLFIRKALLSRYYRRFDAIITYSSKGAQDYIALGVPRERVFIAPNAVSSAEADAMLAQCDKNPDLITNWKRERGISKQLVLFVGRLIHEKRIHDLIEACGALKDKAALMIVGDGPERDVLENLARQTGGQTIFTGSLRGEDLARCFAAADIFVLPGRGGLAVQEAMAYGLPVVVASADGTESDLVRPQQNGVLVYPGDVTALTNSIRNLLDETETRQRFGAESRRIITQEHNLDHMVRGFLHALHYAIAFRRPELRFAISEAHELREEAT